MKEEDRKIGPEIHCTDLKLSRNLSAHVRKSGVDEVTMMHGWIIRYLYENREQDIFQIWIRFTNNGCKAERSKPYRFRRTRSFMIKPTGCTGESMAV